MRVGMENDLPVVNAVDTEGKFVAEVTPWAGVFVKDADPAITADLKDRGLLLGVEPYEHSYPFCWRCDTALLYYAKATWYVRTTAIKDQLIKANDDVDLAPGAHQDRALRRVARRQRRLGAQPRPLLGHAAAHLALRAGAHALRRLHRGAAGSWRPVPFQRIWNSTGPTSTTSSSRARTAAARCAACPRSSTPGSTPAPCRSASGTTRSRTSRRFEERFPADFICEAIDQTRGWFYSLIAVATLIEGRSSYKRVLCLGHILDGEGQKMSKSKGNVVQPDDILDHQGADAFRWFMFASQQPWSPRRFSADMVDEVVRKFLLTLWNTYSFFTLYANIDRFDPTAQESPVEERPLLDRWLVGELNTLVQDVTAGLEAYDATGTCRAIQQFVDDLSNWYVRRSRRRFWKSESDADKLAAYHTLLRGARHGDQAARAVHAVRRRGAVPEPGALGRRVGARRACTCAPGRSPTSRPSTPACRSTWRRRGAWSRWAAPRATPRRSRRASRWPRWSSRCPRPRRAPSSGSATSCSTSSTSRTCGSSAARTSSSPTSSSPTSRCSGPSWASGWARCRRRSRRRTRRRWSPPCAPTAPPSSQLPDGELSLAEEELLIETGSPEGYQVESEAGRVVALKTEVDEALREEGLARELIHAVQLARKAADLRIEDTISLTLDVPEELRPPAERHRGAIMAETLASAFALGEAAGDHRETARVDGHEVGIGLSVTGTIFTVTYG